MADISLVKFTFKPGAKDDWLTWCDELKNRAAEVHETLSNEGVKLEACFISEQEDACFYLMQADDIKKALEISEKSNLPIDNEHRVAFEKSLTYAEKYKPLFVFENSERSTH